MDAEGDPRAIPLVDYSRDRFTVHPQVASRRARRFSAQQGAPTRASRNTGTRPQSPIPVRGLAAECPSRSQRPHRG